MIDADTSYNALLGRPWLHTSKAAVLTLRQCLKYTDEHDNGKMIQGDANPFHGEDVNYVDAKSYKSIDFGLCQVSLDLDEGARKKSLRLLLCLKRSCVLSIATLMK